MAAKKRTGSPGWDRPAPKIRADAKIKMLPAEDQETLWILLNPTDPTVPAYTIEAGMAYLQEEYGMSVAKSTFSEWCAWYALKLRMDRAEERALQAREKYARENPAAALQELDDFAQFVFTSETFEDRDVLNYSRVKRARLLEQAAKQKERIIDLKEREITQKDTALAQAERKLAILEAKAAKTDAADQVMGNGKLTEEEKAAELKRIFRMG